MATPSHAQWRRGGGEASLPRRVARIRSVLIYYECAEPARGLRGACAEPARSLHGNLDPGVRLVEPSYHTHTPHGQGVRLTVWLCEGGHGDMGTSLSGMGPINLKGVAGGAGRKAQQNAR